MHINNTELVDITERMGKKFGSDITLNGALKKLSTSDISYTRERNGINLLKPCHRSTYMLKHFDFKFKDTKALRTKGINLDQIISIEQSKDRRKLIVRDLDGKQIEVENAPDAVEISTKRNIPLDLFLNMM